MPMRSFAEPLSTSGEREREREQRTFLTPVTVEASGSLEGGFVSEDGTNGNGNGLGSRVGKLRRKSASTSVLLPPPSCSRSIGIIAVESGDGNGNGFVRGGQEIPESSPPPYMPLPPPAILPTRSQPDSQVDEDSDHNQHSEEEGEEMIYTSWTHSSGANRVRIQGSGGRYMHITHHTPIHSSNSNGHVANAVYPGVRVKASGSNLSLRHRIFAAASGVELRSGDEDERVICTTPGMVCAGETETETDEPSRHLPTARVPRQASGLSTSFSFSPSTSRFPRLSWKRMLFQFLRGLAIVPASLGFIWCLWHIYVYVPDTSPSAGRAPPDRIDYTVAALWALLTAHQCLSLTTGLHTRWRHYYPPLSTLVRLLALQGICWPATHLTVNILEAGKRPVVVWAVIGTTTCMSRSIQIWVVSNLPTNSASGEREREKQRRVGGERGYWKKWNKWRRRRRWDWREICVKCVLPAGVLYFVMAWTGELRRELMT